MRIAAKRLRYLLELSEPLFGQPREEGREGRQGAAGPARRDPRLRRADAARGRARRAAARRGRGRRASAAAPPAPRTWTRRSRRMRRTARATAGSSCCSCTPRARRDLLHDAFRARVAARSSEDGFRDELDAGLQPADPPRNARTLGHGSRDAPTPRPDRTTRPAARAAPAPASASSTASCRGSTSTTAWSQLAEDEHVPLLERVKFLAIYHTNLDEFFMVRVAGLHDQVDAGIDEAGADGLDPSEAIDGSTERVQERADRERAAVGGAASSRELAEHGIRIVDCEECERSRARARSTRSSRSRSSRR